MTFSNSEPSLSHADIADAEAILGMSLPIAVREHYLAVNGGSPVPYVYEDTNLETVVSEFLPLKSEHIRTALKTYEHLVLRKKLVPRPFFPFAVDGGGDYFFVDCSTSDGVVHFFRSDSARGAHLLNLRVGYKKFWPLLKPE